MTSSEPNFVGSMTSGVDGASEGGRLSTSRLSSVLVLYSVPLLQELKRRGYNGRLTVDPELQDDGWVIKLTYEGDPPADVPELWHGRRVVVAPVPTEETAKDG
ncbi:MAG: hypothetical protein J2P39_14680 [Candidatus Dormibacteraeota bacterium]|nr:hypothetical protein [Candidatus Dormibacteraeota bacterium]